MANLRYSDKHNMVAFLKKPNESVGFTKIVDFLKGTSFRHALTHNPTIYDSLVKHFRQTATVKTLTNGIQELVASIDNKEYTIIEASFRSNLQLADATGISNLPDAEIYEGLATLGGYVGDHVPLLPRMLAGTDPVPSTTIPPPITEPSYSSPPRQIDRQDVEIPQSQGPTTTSVADEATTTGVGVETGGATTTTSGLDVGLDSGNIHESPLRSHKAPLSEGNTSGSAEDNLQLKELMAIVPKLVTRIDSLEKELKETKQTLGNVVLTLVKKVKSFEVALKRKSKKVVLSDSEDEEIENQGRNIQDIEDDPLVSLVRDYMEEKASDLVTPTKISASGETQEEDISPTILEAAKTLSKVSSQNVCTYKRRARSASLDFFSAAKERLNTAGVEVNTGRVEVNPVPSPVKGQREGKAPITEEDVQATKKKKAEIEQEEAKYKRSKNYLNNNRRKAEVQEAAQYYTKEDWDTIRVKLEANAKLTKCLQGENVSNDDFAKRIVDMKSEEEVLCRAEGKSKEEQSHDTSTTRDYMSTFGSLLNSEIEKTRVKRAGIELQKESSKKQKTIGIEEESAAEPVVAKEEEIEEQIKKRGKRKKQKARKGIHADKTTQHEVEEDMEALVKGNDTDSSSGTDIPISVVPVAIKPPSIANWKIIKLGKKGVYQIIREDGTYTTYINFGAMLKSISRDDLTELYRLVMQRYGTNGPEDEYERCLTLESDIYMLTERRYPLPADVCQAMLDKKLQGAVSMVWESGSCNGDG
ncbi:hypothetical protein Tco_1184301 [Tanacetum coccineum]